MGIWFSWEEDFPFLVFFFRVCFAVMRGDGMMEIWFWCVKDWLFWFCGNGCRDLVGMFGGTGLLIGFCIVPVFPTMNLLVKPCLL